MGEPYGETSSGLPNLETLQQYKAREKAKARAAAAAAGDHGFFGFPPNFWPRHILLRLLFILGIVAAYYGLSRVTGNGLAAFLAWLAGTGWVLGMIAQQPRSDGWGGLAVTFIYGILLAFAVLVAWALYRLAAMIEAIRTDPQEFERKTRRALLGFVYTMIAALGMVLFERLF